MVAPIAVPVLPDLARYALNRERPATTEAAMGLPGLILGAASSMVALLALDSEPVFRTMTLLALLTGVALCVAQDRLPLPAGPTELIAGVLVGIAAGGAVASLVLLLGPSSMAPVAVLIAAPAAGGWLVRSVRRASAVIDLTVAELTLLEPPSTGSDPAGRRP